MVMKRCFVVCCILIIATVMINAKTIYVDVDSQALSPDGSSWQNAYADLQTAVDAADPCDVIWVAQGTYTPAGSYFDFRYLTGINFLGGFSGTESDASQRNPQKYKTVLNGDKNGSPVTYLLLCNGCVDVVLDGFYISGANRGVMLTSSATDYVLNNCVFENNAYGVYCNNSNAIIENCLFRNNEIGFYKTGSSGTGNFINDCVFRMNTDAGVQAPNVIDLIIANSIFDYNYDGIYISDSDNDVRVVNCTIVYNEAVGVEAASDILVANSIIWGNLIQISGIEPVYSCIQDYASAEQTNISDYPLFAYDNPALMNYHLDPASPCVDMGLNDAVTGLVSYDYEQDDRIFDGTVDMGVDEVVCGNVSDIADLNGSGEVNLGDFVLFSQSWLADETHENWDSQYQYYNLDTGNTVIDADDLGMFVEGWLWQACWKN